MAVTGMATMHIGRRMKEISYLWVFFTRPAVRNGRKPAGNLAFHDSLLDQFKKSKKILQEI
jgi:hypothetical protein